MTVVSIAALVAVVAVTTMMMLPAHSSQEAAKLPPKPESKTRPSSQIPKAEKHNEKAATRQREPAKAPNIQQEPAVLKEANAPQGAAPETQIGEKPDCSTLGYLGPDCADCDTLLNYTQDESLYAECKQCCIEVESIANDRYRSAVLIAPPQMMNEGTTLSNFVAKHSKKWGKAFTVSYGRTMEAYFLMKGKHKLGDHTSSEASREEKAPGGDVVHVESWSEDQIVEYLNYMLDVAPTQQRKSTSKQTTAQDRSKSSSPQTPPRRDEL